jgi:hypothetical protein
MIGPNTRVRIIDVLSTRFSEKGIVVGETTNYLGHKVFTVMFSDHSGVSYDDFTDSQLVEQKDVTDRFNTGDRVTVIDKDRDACGKHGIITHTVYGDNIVYVQLEGETEDKWFFEKEITERID